MAAWLLQNDVRKPEDLRDFAVDGYQFNNALSSGQTLVFTRREGDAA